MSRRIKTHHASIRRECLRKGRKREQLKKARTYSYFTTATDSTATYDSTYEYANYFRRVISSWYGRSYY